MSTLQSRLDVMARDWPLSRPLSQPFRRFIEEAPEEALYHINPLRYAEAHGLDEREAIDLFVHASRVGIVDLSWNVLCYGCGGYLQSTQTLRDLKSGVHCPICDLHVEAALDDAVEVSFTVSPLIRPIRFHQPEGLTSGPDILRTAFTPNRSRSPEREKQLSDARLLLDFVPSGGVQTYPVPLQGGAYRLVTATHHAGVRVEVSGPETSDMQALRAEIQEGAVILSTTSLRPGPVALEVHNPTGRAVSFSLLVVDSQSVNECEAGALKRFRPFLTGKRILTTQSFRELYRAEGLSPGTSFALRSLTFLFTDLKDSTQLYDRVGDMTAYDLVQEHFRILSEVVAEYEGAIVKTIGDAIMATFARSDRAMMAALEMHARIRAWSQQGGESLFLKIGLHEGSCIAVTSNDRLDYFGQTVNQAARIQALAEAGEICFSDPVLAYPGLLEAVQEHAELLDAHQVQLKGIQEQVRVHRAVGRAS